MEYWNNGRMERIRKRDNRIREEWNNGRIEEWNDEKEEQD
jgi:hypothetical protein